jgi:serine protease
MRQTKVALIILFLIALISIGQIAVAQENFIEFDAQAAAAQDPEYLNQPLWAPGSIIVDFKDYTAEKEIEKLEKDLGIHLEYVSPFAKPERFMRGTPGESRMNEIINKLRQNPDVEYAEPDYYFHTLAPVPNDPLYKYQWNFEKINTRGAWDFATGNGVIVAVIDTGVAYKDSGRFHRVEDLDKTLFVKGYNFVDNNDLPLDDNAHGTHVTGTIAQSTNNHKGVAGIAYKSKIMPLKVLSGNGFGRISDIADAIRYAADNNAKVINMSLGGPFPSIALKLACKYAYDKGCVIICAAGNSRSNNPGYPAAFSECVSVSATRFDDKLAPYTNRGPKITIAAPGGDTTVDQNGDGKPDGVVQNTIAMRNPEKEGYYFFQGTSMASPHVAAVAALIASTGITNNKEIVNILKKTARKKNLPLEEGYGAGIVDARAAVAYSGGGYSWLKLILAVIVLIIIIIIFSGISSAIKFSPLFHIGWFIGACNLFFLPALLKGNAFPGMGLLTHSPAEWDIFILGVGSYANPLFYSALIPFIISVFLYKTKFQKLAAGLALGIGINLLYHFFFSHADIQWIPGTFALDKLWLLVNIVISAVLMLVMIKTDNQAGKNEVEKAN